MAEPASDLGLAIAHLRDLADTGKQWSGMRSDLRALLAAYDGQAARLAAAHEALGLACVALHFWPHGEPSATLAKCRAAYAMIAGAVGAGEAHDG